MANTSRPERMSFTATLVTTLTVTFIVAGGIIATVDKEAEQPQPNYTVVQQCTEGWATVELKNNTLALQHAVWTKNEREVLRVAVPANASAIVCAPDGSFMAWESARAR